MAFGSEMLDLPEGTFTILRDLIREKIGIHYDGDRRTALADKLSARVLECGLSSFLDYYYLLKYGPNAEQEWPAVADALSVPETYFWREMDQVRALVDILLPQYAAANPGKPIDIWSAACASGEEPLTIAMALDEAGWFERASIRIRASDASQAALTRARAGYYKQRSFRTLPTYLREKYFTARGDGWQIVDSLHARVDWAQVNLMAPSQMAACVGASFVFCRNVFIYFSPSTIARTVQRFAAGMQRPGYLFTGASESLVRINTEFELREVGGAFVYALD
jgi:chemotaxis protein methyltransferase CheR